MNLPDYWFPYVITHFITLLLILICYKWPRIGKVAWGIIFILAGIFNIYTGISNPDAYIGYEAHALSIYKKFIQGVFSSYTTEIISLIGLGQIIVGFLLLMKKNRFFLGILGGIIILVAIAPLGVGSAFPSTLLMSLSLILLYRRYGHI